MRSRMAPGLGGVAVPRAGRPAGPLCRAAMEKLQAAGMEELRAGVAKPAAGKEEALLS